VSGPRLSTRATVRRLVAVSPPPWRRLGAAIGLGVAASGATIGLLAGSGALVDRAATRPGLGAIAGLLAVVEVVAFARAPLRYAERLCAHDAGFLALARWRTWLFDRLEPLSPAALGSWRSGDLTRRAVADVDGLADLYLRGLGPLVSALVVAATAVVVEGVLVPGAALVLGLALGVALAGGAALAWWGRPGDAAHEEAGALAADVVDLVHGAPELLALGAARAHLDRIERRGAVLGAAARRRARAAGATAALSGIGVAVAVTGVLVLAVEALRGHRLEPIMLAVLPLVALGAFEVVPALAGAVTGLAEVAAGGRRLLSLAETPAPVRDPDDPVAPPTGGVEIRLHDARLRYAADRPLALDGVSLALAPGTATALVGPSGSGKTTVLHALLRFWPLESGSVLADGVDTAAMRQRDTRALFALVDQDAPLFAGTIGDNVALADPDAPEAARRQALDAARLGDFVAGLPLGLDTPVGEHGARLSGGQRRRVALARALLAGRPVLLLDEPGAGLDPETADRMLEDLVRAPGARAVLAVTHRREEARHFGRVVELEAGRVVGRRFGVGAAIAQDEGTDGSAL